MSYHERWRNFLSESLRREAGRSFRDQSQEIQGEMTNLFQDFEEEYKEAGSSIVSDYISLAVERLQTHLNREFSTKAGDKSWVFQGIYGVLHRHDGFVILGRLMFSDRSYQERTLSVTMSMSGWKSLDVSIENGRPEDHKSSFESIGFQFQDLGG